MHFPVHSYFMTYHRVLPRVAWWVYNNGTGTSYPSSRRFVVGFVFFFVVFCRSLLVLLYLLVCPLALCCLSFFDLWILITPLVSSNSSRWVHTQVQIKHTCTDNIYKISYLLRYCWWAGLSMHRGYWCLSSIWKSYVLIHWNVIGVYFGTLYLDNSHSALLARHDITEITLLAYPLSSRLLFDK